MFVTLPIVYYIFHFLKHWTTGASTQNVTDINYVCITELHSYMYTHAN